MVKVSVLTYVYVTKTNGRLKLLEDAINSVKNQQFKDYEHIIVDDGSEVGVKKWLKKKGFPKIKYIRNEHTGIRFSAEPLRTCLRNAKGEYSIILPSDDMQMKKCLKTLSNYLDKHPKCIAVIGSHVWTKGKKKRLVQRKDDPNATIIKKNTVHACATMFRTSVLKKIELPEDETGFAADYDLWLKISEHGKFHRIKDMVLIYRKHKDATRNVTGHDKKYRAKCLNFVLGNAKKRRGLA